MKKRILASLLAICMMFGSYVILASAAFAADVLVTPKSGSSLKADNLTEVSKTPATITVAEKATVKLNGGTNKITADNIDEVFDFTEGTTPRKFKGYLDSYFTITSGKVSGNDVSVTFKAVAMNNVYKVTAAIADDGEAQVGVNVEEAKDVYKYQMNPSATVTATVDKWVSKLSALSIGVRFYGENYANLVAAEVAKVDAVIERASGKQLVTTAGVVNKINDLMPGDVVTLTTSLKDPTESKYYGFNCWVDGNGEVLSTADKYVYTATGNGDTVLACYVELQPRHTISFSVEGAGKIVTTEEMHKAKAREIFVGDGQMSAMEGRNVTFTFVPDDEEKYEVTKVRIDGKNVTSLLRLVEAKDWAELKSTFKTIVNGTGKGVKCYTFYGLSDDHSIEVVFEPIAVLEAPEGIELETVAAEGLTLATGAADENGEGDKATTVPGEDGAAGSGSAATGVVNPATGSASSSIAVFAVVTLAAGAAYVTFKKKED